MGLVGTFAAAGGAAEAGTEAETETEAAVDAAVAAGAGRETAVAAVAGAVETAAGVAAGGIGGESVCTAAVAGVAGCTAVAGAVAPATESTACSTGVRAATAAGAETAAGGTLAAGTAVGGGEPSAASSARLSPEMSAAESRLSVSGLDGSVGRRTRRVAAAGLATVTPAASVRGAAAGAAPAGKTAAAGFLTGVGGFWPCLARGLAVAGGGAGLPDTNTGLVVAGGGVGLVAAVTNAGLLAAGGAGLEPAGTSLGFALVGSFGLAPAGSGGFRGSAGFGPLLVALKRLRKKRECRTVSRAIREWVGTPGQLKNEGALALSFGLLSLSVAFAVSWSMFVSVSVDDFDLCMSPSVIPLLLLSLLSLFFACCRSQWSAPFLQLISSLASFSRFPTFLAVSFSCLVICSSCPPTVFFSSPASLDHFASFFVRLPAKHVALELSRLNISGGLRCYAVCATFIPRTHARRFFPHLGVLLFSALHARRFSPSLGVLLFSALQAIQHHADHPSFTYSRDTSSLWLFPFIRALTGLFFPLPFHRALLPTVLILSSQPHG